MAGFSLNPPPVSLSGPAASPFVCRYAKDSGYVLLPNVWCKEITETEGVSPPIARLAYVFDDAYGATFGWPSRVEQTFPLTAQGNSIVQVDDELVVMGTNPDGTPLILFHGFAQIPQIDLTPTTEACDFLAVGVSSRAFDHVIHGRYQRDADRQTVTDGSADRPTNLPCRFNPSDETVGGLGGYLGNCVATGAYTVSPDGTYPVFLDERLIEQGFGTTSYWYVSDGIQYLLATAPASLSDWITLPALASIEPLLTAQYPTGSGVFSVGGPSTSSADITLRDYDANGKPFPVAMADMLGYAGFAVCWATGADSDGNPVDYLRIYRRDAASTNPAKPLYLASEFAAFDPTRSNVNAVHVARDVNDVINEYRIETASAQVEVTVILAPLFTPASGDQISPARDAFSLANQTGATATVRDKYRKYGADECGDGHWNAGTTTWVAGQALDLSAVFPPDKNTGLPTYVARYRKPSQTLIATDSLNKPLKATLEIATGFSSLDPSIVTQPFPGATWRTVPNGWELLPDRLGIRVTAKDPDQWASGNAKLGDIRGITAVATPTAQTCFVLRLTTVIEGDRGISVVAPKRVASPTKYARRRLSDGRDHFQYCAIAPGSLNYSAMGGDGTNPYVQRDDTQAALVHAYQLRSSTEFPVLAGSVEIPFITTYYALGDLITGIAGRDVSFQTNTGVAQGEAPCYGWVRARSWHFTGDRQWTTLQVCDARAESP